MIRAENITKKYMGVDGENIVLDKLCFSAREGEFCIVTGQSGCGKSTLLNILSCLDSFDEGTLILNHKNVKELRRKELYDIRRRDI
ncbi:MAG: ATP-binding cassette domain-containing protein, partial [Oscillospiraceae bacterium]